MADEIGYQASTIASWTHLAAQSNETNPDLVWPKSTEVYDRMRREDPQVGSVVRAVTLPIRSAEWVIDPAGAPEEVVDLIAKDLGLPVKGRAPMAPHRLKGRFSWDDFIRLALLELVYGHSVFEQVYRVEGDRLHLHKLAWRPPRTIAEFKVAPDGGLEAIVQHGLITGSRGEVRIPVDRLVVFVNEREGANWLGQSLLRQAYKVWLLKDRVLRSQAQTIERNGLGVPTYTGTAAPEGADETAREAWEKSEREAGLDIAKNFRAGDNSGVSIPNGAKLELLAVTGKLPDTDKPIKYYDEQIARAVLAHVLNLGGDQSTGSYALSDTLEGIFTNSLNAVARQIADVVQQHVIEDLVDLNFGTEVPAPRLVVAPIGSRTPVTAEAIKTLLDAGAITADAALEAHVRELLHLPVRETAADGVTDTTDAASARAAAEVVQKAYLGVGTVLTRREARELARRAGAQITAEATDPEEAA